VRNWGEFIIIVSGPMDGWNNPDVVASELFRFIEGTGNA
jgi:hypothetical protein